MTFEIEGRERGFRFGTYTFKLINELAHTSTVEEVFSRLGSGDEGFACTFYFCCAKHWALSSNKPIDFNEAQVADWLDELGNEKVSEMTTEMFHVYVESKKKTMHHENQQALSNGKL